jgi:hypothetical protein
MTGFGKPLRLDDLPERLQRQIREGRNTYQDSRSPGTPAVGTPD